MDIEKTIEFIKAETVFRDGYTFNKRTNKRISALVPVHVFGNAVRLHTRIDFFKERNIRIVEDATESLGTVYKEGIIAGRHSGTIGDIGCYSFNGNKIITTGGGGMIVTNETRYAERARYLTTQAKDDEIRYIHNDIGYNFRLTNVQAALGVAQMERLPEYLEAKRASYTAYKREIDQIAGLHLADVPSYANNNYWMYALQIDAAVYGKDRESLMGYLQEKRIQTRPVWYLNHLQKPYRKCQNYEINMAPRLLARTLNIPCSVNLTKIDINRVVECLRNA
jgi:dTDP-4-amino-4,6-dideoxygalactose transaminase